MDFTKLEQYLQTLGELGYHGTSIVVAKDGETVYQSAQGYRDREGTQPSSVNDPYYIFSCTKPLTCVAALMLTEQGKLSMKDPVAAYLPEYAHLTVQEPDGTLRPVRTALTVEHLLTMTGGFTYNINTKNIREAAARPDATTRSIAAAFAKDPLAFEPGTRYLYSLCHDILAAVIEVAAGESFGAYLQRTVFDPLEMRSTTFHPDPQTRKNMGALYEFDHVAFTGIYGSQENEYVLHPNYESGGAGLVSSAADYNKVLTALSMGGIAKNGYRLLKPETVEAMGINRLSPEAMKTFYEERLFGYGWGWCGRCHVNPRISGSPSAIGEFGWDGAGNDLALADPVNRVAFFFATGLRHCRYGYNVVHPQIRTLVYQGLGLIR